MSRRQILEEGPYSLYAVSSSDLNDLRHSSVFSSETSAELHQEGV